MGGQIGNALCRDCFQYVASSRRCTHCNSPRLISHPELHELSIAHLDCDAFYAAIEKRDNPALLDKPLIVGGGGPRGVVSTACYIARTYGVHSAMPMFKAMRACPHAVIIPPDMERYRIASRQIRSLMDKLTPDIEPLSLDEAFLDLSGTRRLHGQSPAQCLVRLASEIEKEVGITVSIGLSHNKFLAKVASDLKKPRGFAIIGHAETLSFLADQPVSLIWGVGKAMLKTLHGDGISRISQLQKMDERDLMKRYGALGGRLYRLARGQDTRTVSANAPAKSVSSETTFNQDIRDYDILESILWQQCERLSKSLKGKQLAGWTVVLKLKTAHHKIITRSHALQSPTQLAHRLFDIGKILLVPLTKEANSYRLLGIGVSNLVEATIADTPDLIDPKQERNTQAERAMDILQGRFGEAVIRKGRSYKKCDRK